MSRNASGTYSLPAGNPVSTGTTIDASWANTTLEDIGNEITNSLSRTGAGGMLAPFRIDDGAITTPGLSFLNETNSGLYRSSSGNVRMSITGVDVLQMLVSGLIVPAGKTMTMNGNATVGGTFASTGAVTFASTLAVTGVLSANGGLTGNVTSAGTSTFNNVTISGSLDMDTGSSATITGLTTPTNPSDAASKQYVDDADDLLLPKTGGTMSGVIEMGSNKVTGLGTPTTDNDAANKLYVDQVAQGLDAKASCRVATTGSITLSGTQTIDGVAVIASDRVLVKNQATASQNGIYVVAAGSWARSTDADTWNELVKAFTFVEEGTVNANNGFICTVAAGGTLGSTSVTWTQFSGAGQITAGTGMTKSGNTLNVNTASASRIVVGADEIDLAATGVSANTYKSVTVDVYGRVTAGTNPTTLSGYGISDAYTQTQTNTLLAAKLSLTGGTMSGALAMGSQPITGLQDPTNSQDAVTLNYVTTLFGSTSAAAQSATDAANSATDAQTYATNASNSATDANTAKVAAETALDDFTDQYLGAKSSDPSTDNDGNALQTGALYWNTTTNVMKVWDGSAWVTSYLPASGYLEAANNLSDLNSTTTARTNLGVAIGLDVQAYDADTAKTDVAQTFTAQQTFGELKEGTYTLGTSGSIALDPANGSIQSSTLSGTITFTDSLESGQTVVLMLNGGASNTVNWPTIAWVTSTGNSAPTLTANDTLVFWKVSTTLYGAYVGSYA
ncbi:MAG: hypothetical protein VW518_00155 [Burkholderiaceae bacterium]